MFFIIELFHKSIKLCIYYELNFQNIYVFLND